MQPLVLLGVLEWRPQTLRTGTVWSVSFFNEADLSLLCDLGEELPSSEP